MFTRKIFNKIYRRMMDINIVYPISPNKTLMRYYYYFRDEDYFNFDFIKKSLEQSDKVKN
jgi:hypothetical protein